MARFMASWEDEDAGNVLVAVNKRSSDEELDDDVAGDEWDDDDFDFDDLDDDDLDDDDA
jgi:hypothetical protein